MTLIDKAAFLGFSAGWSAVRHLPAGTAYGLFRRTADVVWRRNGRSVQRLEANLRRAAGDMSAAELHDLTRHGVRSYCRYWCDAFRMQDWSKDEIISRVRTENGDILWDIMGRGKGAVVALPHMGNWDLAGAWACLTVSPLATVAERLKPEELFDKFVAFRESLGMKVLPLTGGAANTMTVLGDHLKDGGLVCLPAERDLSGRGVPVTLFGEDTRMPAGPAMLSLRTGAALIPTTIWYEGNEPEHRIVIRFEEPIEPPAKGESAGRLTGGSAKITTMTQQLADVFSARIAEHPQDWHMMQRLFLSDLSPDDPRRTQ